MLVFAHIIVLLSCLLMFVVNRPNKIAIILFILICMSAVEINYIPFGGSIYLISFAFLISEMSNIRKMIRETSKQKIGIGLFIMAFGSIVSLCNSPHYNSIFQWTRFFILEFIGKYFAIVYSLWAISDEKDYKSIASTVYWSNLLLFFFGVLNFITKKAYWVHSVYTSSFRSYDVLEVGDSDRFRVQAMMQSSFVYGYICALLLLFFVWLYQNGLLKNKKFRMSLVCCIFGIVTCGSRTVILITIVGVAVYALLYYSFRRWIRYAIIGIIFFLCIANFIPGFANSMELFVEAFSTDQNLQGARGSSIGMRTLQFLAVLDHIRGHELFGNGIDFFTIDLGWGEGQSVDADLWGLEGIHMNLLLERGIWGLIIWICYIYILFKAAYSYYNKQKFSVSINISVLSIYIFYSLTTGELLSAYPTMLILGIILKYSYITSINTSK